MVKGYSSKLENTNFMAMAAILKCAKPLAVRGAGKLIPLAVRGAGKVITS